MRSHQACALLLMALCLAGCSSQTSSVQSASSSTSPQSYVGLTSNGTSLAYDTYAIDHKAGTFVQDAYATNDGIRAIRIHLGSFCRAAERHTRHRGHLRQWRCERNGELRHNLQSAANRQLGDRVARPGRVCRPARPDRGSLRIQPGLPLQRNPADLPVRHLSLRRRQRRDRLWERHHRRFDRFGQLQQHRPVQHLGRPREQSISTPARPAPAAPPSTARPSASPMPTSCPNPMASLRQPPSPSRPAGSWSRATANNADIPALLTRIFWAQVLARSDCQSPPVRLTTSAVVGRAVRRLHLFHRRGNSRQSSQSPSSQIASFGDSISKPPVPRLPVAPG